MAKSKVNPRRTNGARRDAIRRWVLATQDHCALCGKPVDKSLKTPHPMSAEVQRSMEYFFTVLCNLILRIFSVINVDDKSIKSRELFHGFKANDYLVVF